MSTPIVPSMRPEPDRDRMGRYLLPDPDTGKRRAWSRATTIAHALSDEYHLSQWKRRMVIQGIALAPELLVDVQREAARLAEAGDDWRAAKEPKKALDELCDVAATTAGADRGSSLGTALHSLTEWSDAGRLDEVEVPEELADDLAAYTHTMNAEGIVRPVEYIERIIVNRTVDGAGTLDRLVWLPDGRLVVADLKTQKSIDFGWLEIAIQLAEYAYADAMVDPETGELVEMPDVDKRTALVMWLPVGQARCTLHEIDIEAGWHAAKLAAEVRRVRSKSKDMGRAYRRAEPVRASLPTGDQLLYLVRTAPHPDALEGLWRGAGVGEWTTHHTEAARIRKAELLEGVAA